MLVPATLRDRHRLHRDDFTACPETRTIGSGRDLVGLRKDGSEVAVEIAPEDPQQRPDSRLPQAPEEAAKDAQRLPVKVLGEVADRRADCLVHGMHGPHRIPSLLKRTDQLARGIVVVTKP